MTLLNLVPPPSFLGYLDYSGVHILTGLTPFRTLGEEIVHSSWRLICIFKSWRWVGFPYE